MTRAGSLIARHGVTGSAHAALTSTGLPPTQELNKLLLGDTSLGFEASDVGVAARSV
jgi:hypothetical protein